MPDFASDYPALLAAAGAGLLLGFIFSTFFQRRRLRRWFRRWNTNRTTPPWPPIRAVIDELQAERQDAENDREATRHALRRLELALESLSVGVVVLNTNGTVVARNSAAATYSDPQHGALVSAALENLLQAALEGHAETKEVEVLSNPRATYEVTAAPINNGGDQPAVIGAVAIVRDISAQQRIDEVRRDFVTNVSHELKSPIGALSVLADSLPTSNDSPVDTYIRTRDGTTTTETENLVERMQDEIQRISDTIDDLLTLSYIEANPIHDHELADLNQIAAECVERVSETATQQGVSIHFTPAARDVTMSGSRVQLASAIFNLLDNAIKFTDPSEATNDSAESAAVTITVLSHDDALIVSVADQGVGIPETEQGRIFERFYRVDRARSRPNAHKSTSTHKSNSQNPNAVNRGGTGLGLSIVRHCVMNHKGTLEVASREGAGATFTIKFPKP